MNNEMDNKIKSLLSTKKVEPSRDRWLEIESILDNDQNKQIPKNRKLYMIMSLAASLGIILLSVVYFKSMEQTSEILKSQEVAANDIKAADNNELVVNKESVDTVTTPKIKSNDISQIKSINNIPSTKQYVKRESINPILETTLIQHQKIETPLVNQQLATDDQITGSKNITTMDFDSIYKKVYHPLKLNSLKFNSKHSFDAKQIVEESTPRKAIWRKALDVAEENAITLIAAINDRNFETEK